jgi:hypothetical protein
MIKCVQVGGTATHVHGDDGIADKPSGAAGPWGYCSAVSSNGRRWVVDAYKNDGNRYIVESDELSTAFLHPLRRLGLSSSLSSLAVSFKLQKRNHSQANARAALLLPAWISRPAESE